MNKSYLKVIFIEIIVIMKIVSTIFKYVWNNKF